MADVNDEMMKNNEELLQAMRAEDPGVQTIDSEECTGNKQEFLKKKARILCVKRDGGGFWILDGEKIEKTITSRPGDKGYRIYRVEEDKKYLLFAKTTYRCGI